MGWDGSYRDGVGCVMQGWGVSCRGQLGHTGVGGVCHPGMGCVMYGWGGSCRGGVGPTRWGQS